LKISITCWEDNSIARESTQAIESTYLYDLPAENKCSSGSPDNPVDTVIPIVVGCVLGGLVIIVVIGYIIGRRRARAQNNYETLP